jgi:hypothetical protein
MTKIKGTFRHYANATKLTAISNKQVEGNRKEIGVLHFKTFCVQLSNTFRKAFRFSACILTFIKLHISIFMPIPVAVPSAAVRLLGFWVRIPSDACMFISCDCCMFSGTCLCVGLIPHPEESYEMWCVWA